MIFTQAYAWPGMIVILGSRFMACKCDPLLRRALVRVDGDCTVQLIHILAPQPA